MHKKAERLRGEDTPCNTVSSRVVPCWARDGTLRESGYATALLLDYKRESIRANSLRIKEWDYYLVLTDTHALAVTIADNAYMGLDSISLLDFTAPWETTLSKMRILPLGRTGLPSTSGEGDVAVEAVAIRSRSSMRTARGFFPFIWKTSAMDSRSTAPSA